MCRFSPTIFFFLFIFLNVNFLYIYSPYTLILNKKKETTRRILYNKVVTDINAPLAHHYFTLLYQKKSTSETWWMIFSRGKYLWELLRIMYTPFQDSLYKFHVKLVVREEKKRANYSLNKKFWKKKKSHILIYRHIILNVVLCAHLFRYIMMV